MKSVKILSGFLIISAVFTALLVQIGADETAAQIALKNVNEAVATGDIGTVVKLCTEIVDTYPGSREAAEARKKLKFVEAHSDYKFEPLRRLFKMNELVREGLSARSQGRPYQEYYKSALEGYQAIIADYPNCSLVPQLHSSIAGSYRRLGKYERAIAVLKEIIDKYSTDEHAMWAQWMLAQIYHFELNNYDQAVVEYKRYIEKYPKAESIDLAKSGIQSIYMNQGKDDLYVDTLMEEINKDPNSRRAGSYYLTIAGYFYRKGNYDKAIPIYEKVIKDYPNPDWHLTEGVYSTLGRYYFEVKGDYEKALMYYEKLAKEYPDSKWLKVNQPDISLIKKTIEDKEKKKETEKSVKEKMSAETDKK
ncbi:MAG: tetratricopeptide repeat protein [bacterium]|nr:tetratricopeptide repeat protein [bacterium]